MKGLGFIYSCFALVLYPFAWRDQAKNVRLLNRSMTRAACARFFFHRLDARSVR